MIRKIGFGLLTVLMAPFVLAFAVIRGMAMVGLGLAVLGLILFPHTFFGHHPSPASVAHAPALIHRVSR